MKKRNFNFAVLAVAGLGIAAISNGCAAANALCCKEYQPGVDMAKVDFGVKAEIKGQFTAFAQAAGDLAAIAAGAQADVTNACRSIAVDLGENPDDPDQTGADLMNYWCGKATAQIGAVGATVSVTAVPVQCSASIQANVDCKARCDVSGKCDLKVNPPKCTGGTLSVDCKGDCNVSATAPKIECEGTCGGMCEGTCEAQAGVNCNGRCNGTCSVAPDMGGNCTGMCNGTCEIKGGLSCTGTCHGKCDAKCTATQGSASVKCSGTCMGEFTPLECKGGKLEGGCTVDAKCEGSCSASANAKAECTPPKLTITVTGTGPKAGILRATLERNMPNLFVVVMARGKAFGESISAIANIGGQITASGKLETKGIACGAFIVDNIVTTTSSFTATLSAATSVTNMAPMK
jgi:hypothetical protein